MDRREAMLRELNLYPQWKLRVRSAQVVQEEPAPISIAAEAITPAVIDKKTPFSSSPSAVSGRSDIGNLGWTELKQQVRDCTACKLRAGCTQTVFGVGDEKADWLFVGEGPGADEDALGEPFVGQAGKLLDNMLMAIKLKRGNNVYIANIVKCRPPGNRNPEPDEIATCLPYLRRQIELVEPKMIVTLGKVASNALLGKDATLASLRGKLHEYRGIPLIVTYHPAYLLRSPTEKAKAWQDLCMAVRARHGEA
jgi:uracil-DNA glycosylase family 4